MQRLAALIMRGRVYAMLIAAVFGVISLLLPPLQPITTTLSGGVVALVALRLGAREALYVILGALAGVMVVAVPLFGGPAAAVVLATIVTRSGVSAGVTPNRVYGVSLAGGGVAGGCRGHRHSWADT